MIIVPIKWLFHWGYTLFSDKPKRLVACFKPHTIPANHRGQAMFKPCQAAKPRLNARFLGELELDSV